MSDVTDAEVEAIDLALVAYRDGDEWSLTELPGRALDNVETIVRELRRYPVETGVLALLAVDEDFVLLVRVDGAVVRVLLSDASAATDWPLARSAINEVGVHVDLDDDPAPVGDLTILADLGFPAAELGELLDDLDLYPEDILGEIADGLGFGDEFEEYVEDLEDPVL